MSSSLQIPRGRAQCSEPRAGGAAASSGWSEPLVDRLKTLWAEGLSASEIALRLGGGLTRNAVLGKIHRLGLSNRRVRGPATRRPARPQRSPRRIAAPAPRRLRADPPPAGDPGLSGLVGRLEAIPAHGCRWPIGDPKAADFAFCGRCATTDPYCPAHRALAYRPGGPKPLEALLSR